MQFSRTGWEAHARAEQARTPALKTNGMLAGLSAYQRSSKLERGALALERKTSSVRVDMLRPGLTDIDAGGLTVVDRTGPASGPGPGRPLGAP